MPSYDAICRAPLLKPAFAALPAAQCRPEGELKRITDSALHQITIGEGALDQAIASALTGREPPQAPELGSAEMCLPAEPRKYLRDALAKTTLAVRAKDKAEMLRVLDSVKSLGDAIPALSHSQKLQNGADLMRLTVELYRRTGQKFLLGIMETLRAELPDAAGFFHTFPLTAAYKPEQSAKTEEQATYERHMRRMARGRACADELAVTALMSQYSGSAREQSAAGIGVTALSRYHGSPSGMFLSCPYLAGRDPSQPAELRAVCHMLEALYDCVVTGGDMRLMDLFERILFSAFAPAFSGDGIAFMQPVSSLPGAEKTEKYPLAERKTCAALPGSEATASERHHILRALYAARGLYFAASGDEALALLCPVDGSVTTHIGKTPVRVTVKGGYPYRGEIKLTVDCKAPVSFTLQLRVPGFAEGATVSVAGGAPVPAQTGKLYAVKREFHTGDEILFHIPLAPRMEEGFRSGLSVLVGSVLMALPADGKKEGWQYGLRQDAELTLDESAFAVRAKGYMLPDWTQRGGYPAPPPQGAKAGWEKELTLVPVSAAARRVALFPRVEKA